MSVSVARAIWAWLVISVPWSQASDRRMAPGSPPITSVIAAATWDQGSEMTNHAQIAAATDLEIYFCDPHSPWQRGSNENTDGLLRQYFPKGTDLAVHRREHLDHVAAELNSRPRKTLGWKTPAQALDEVLAADAA